MLTRAILATGSIADQVVNTIYTVALQTSATGSLIVTNTGVTTANVSVFTFDGSTERLLVTQKISGASGKTWIIPEVERLNLTQGYELRLKQEVAGTINYVYSGVVES